MMLLRGIPASALSAMRFPLTSSCGGVPTWVIVWSAISFPATNQSVGVKHGIQTIESTPRTSDKRVIREIQRNVVRHLGCAAVRVLPVREKLVDRIQGVRLHSIVRRKYDEHRDV